jgi:hypothetical protein
VLSINVKDLKPGMTLTRSVSNRQGLLLLKGDVELSEQNIRVLKSWGIDAVSIKGEDEGGQSKKEKNKSKPVFTPLVESQLREKFAGTLEHPAMVEIMRVAVRLLEKRLSAR